MIEVILFYDVKRVKFVLESGAYIYKHTHESARLGSGQNTLHPPDTTFGYMTSTYYSRNSMGTRAHIVSKLLWGTD